MAIITIKACKCERCGHVWLPRRWPAECCGKCKSAYWNTKKEGSRVKNSK